MALGYVALVGVMKPSFSPRRVRRLVLAALLQIAREPAVSFTGTRDILPDDHQGGQITGGAEIKACIKRGPQRGHWAHHSKRAMRPYS